ncbi:MAG: HmuY family protein [Gemmatimonadota bacterium]
MPLPFRRSDRGALLIAAGVLALAALLVVATLDRPIPPAFPPTEPAPAEVGPRLAGPATYTVDASGPDRWRYFDFSRGATVDPAGPLDWDLAFRRFHIIANGGDGFAGAGGIADLGELRFDSVLTVPDAGYRPNVVGTDTVNPAIRDWYDYGFTSHLLTPRPRVYAVRTADGRYAKLELVSYYCPDARAGCITIRYVYQGDGSRAVDPRMDAAAGAPPETIPAPASGTQAGPSDQAGDAG